MNEFEKEQQEKYQKLDEWLSGEYCLIHLDSGIEGIILPAHLLKRYQVTLQISRFFRGGLELTQEHISTDLVFEGSYFSCFIPLAAIWGATSATGENILWTHSAPREILAKILGESLKLEKGGQTEKDTLVPATSSPQLAPVAHASVKRVSKDSNVTELRKRKPKLSAVEGKADSNEASPVKKKSKKKAPALKLVK